jgi:SAM-dependent methyltransferase
MRLFRHFRLLQPSGSTLIVPAEFNRNSSTVTSLMTAEESGRWLLDRMRTQIGFDSYTNKKLLDFGCGVRFTQAIVNGKLSIGGYVGVDVYRRLIDFLQKSVRDDRFSYVFLDAHHPLYNPAGSMLTVDSTLPITERHFDIICLFSVITHQYPCDSKNIFSMLRRYINEDGHLFFTCFLDDSIPEFEDRSPERNGGRCFYNSGFLIRLVQDCGWQLITQAPADGPLIGDSFVFRPT